MRAPKRLKSRTLKPWRRFKKTFRRVAEVRAEARAWHTDRSVVPGRDAGRAKKNKLTYRWARKGLGAARASDDQRTQIDLSVRWGCPSLGTEPAPALRAEQRKPCTPSR